MFRRPILAILSHAFSEGLGRPQNEAFVLGRETRDELLALSCLGPVFNRLAGLLRSIYVFCTDASPDGAGICQAAESPDTVAELWRHSEQRGYYTQLLSPAAEILASKSEEFSEVYGRRPRVGEAVSSFSASYPLCAKMAAGAWHARRDTVPVIPLTAHLKSLDRIGESCAIPSLPSSVIRTAVADLPLWLLDLRNKRCDRFERVLASSKCPKLAARWLRFLLLLAGDIENPGPSSGFQTTTPVPRGPLDMNVGFATATSGRMQLCLEAFAIWLRFEFDVSSRLVGILLQVLLQYVPTGCVCLQLGTPGTNLSTLSQPCRMLSTFETLFQFRLAG
ncbi:unnamed protein product [Durusdinium trenchii]|uniref:Uncharacterized protein n=1 Tax=Durusdinium trenchii TaxID=1381693 RepID=A0ABP0PJA5_9DINO